MVILYVIKVQRKIYLYILLFQSCEMTRVVKNVQKSPAGGGGAKIKSELKCQNIVVNRPIPPSEKAGSVHDLRRCAVSSLLRVPPQYTTFNERPRPPKPLPKSVAVQVQSIKGCKNNSTPKMFN